MRWPAGGARQDGSTVRRAAVAGRFYEDRPDRLAAHVDGQLASARAALQAREFGRGGSKGRERDVAALVVPHAGHVYSGPVAAFAYAALDPPRVKRVVLLGPAHYVPLSGIGLSTADFWRTPLGDVALDPATSALLRGRFDDVFPADDAHSPEHSLEVQLPFLQRVLGNVGWSLLPLIVGADLPEELAEVIQTCAALPGTLVVVSTDLSHYLDHDAARARDDRTISAILARQPEGIGAHDACGRFPLRGLLAAAPELGWELDLVDARTSGDTAGSRDRVVGYAAFVGWRAESSGEPDGGAPVQAEGARPPERRQAGTSTAVGSAAAGAGAGEPSASVSTGRGAPSAAEPLGAEAPSATEATGSELPRADSSAGQGNPRAGAAGEAPGLTELQKSTRTALLGLARDTIEEALVTGRRPQFDAAAFSAAVRDQSLSRPGAAFVTLRSASGELLGCIGTLRPHQPLAADVAQHAYDAAFRDPRFYPLTPERARGMVIDISVLTESHALPADGYEGLLRRIEPGTGLVVTGGGHRATFLPAVWEQLVTPEAFLAGLWRKAGLPPGAWPAGTTIEAYGSQEFAEAP